MPEPKSWSGSPDGFEAPSEWSVDPGTTESHSGVTELPAPATPACPSTGTLYFEDVASCAGLGTAINIQPGNGHWLYEAATAQVWADFDGDSWLDLLFSSPAGGGQLFLGAADGTFTPRLDSDLAGVMGLGAAAADVDGDGDRDVLVGAAGQDFLLENQGTELVLGAFPYDANLTLGVSFADIDADGVLEAYGANYSCFECDMALPVCTWTSDNFWVQGPSGWEDQLDGLLHASLQWTCAWGFIGLWGDYDADGDPDLYVINDRGVDGADVDGSPILRNTYFRNDGPGCGGTCFEEIARDNGSVIFVDGMGADHGDFDNDGDLDIIVSKAGPPVLLQNDGTGQFADVSADWGLVQNVGVSAWGVVWLDYDNDGDLDLYLATSQQDHVWENTGRAFVETTERAIPAETELNRGAAAADYDRDGKVDLLVGTPGGFQHLFRNTHGNTNNWLGLRLVGVGAGGTDALGARVYLTDDSGRVQLREVKSGNSNGSGSDTAVHFGLGSTLPTEVRIVWPDGVEQLVSVQENAWWEVVR